jgi:asparagine synthase (glutamine-hydrolysing)
MAGIAGTDRPSQQAQVTHMLQKMGHRGHFGSKIIESSSATAGAVWPEAQVRPTPPTLRQQAAWDGNRPPLPEPATLSREREPFALATVTSDGLFLARDPIGVCPLYYGRLDDGALCFASEVKALLELTHDIHEFPPGTYYNTGTGFQAFSTVKQSASLGGDLDAIAASLRLRLEQAVCRKVDDQIMGSWLSGGLDSSVMAALARPLVQELHTFAGGTVGAPDLEFARQVAEFLNTAHHEILVTLKDLLAVLAEVIYHLESFDALLVRSSLTNYLVARHAAEYSGAVFSGEGADELFGGYAYLKQLEPGSLPDELVDITRRLHNTALQRVDRTASAHGLVAHVPFLDLDIVQYALRIPSQFKLRRADSVVEKWILRYALADALPDDVLWRRKAKFWQGAGVGELLAEHAENRISDADFARERTLPNRWVLNTKEELMYYRIFRGYFGDLHDLSWMGRTKGAPVQ